ncbi:MAG: hypothetical protein AAF496_01115 [Pseudomonadota bacterium]
MTLFRALAFLPLIVACAPQDVPLASRSAQFSQYPQSLFDTFETGCAGPGETFRKVGNRSFECSEFLPPDTTAFLILNYDGSTVDLPQSVMRLTSTQNSTGYRVDARLYFKVPQKTGSTVEVPVESERLDQAIGALFQAMGGLPT